MIEDMKQERTEGRLSREFEGTYGHRLFGKAQTMNLPSVHLRRPSEAQLFDRDALHPLKTTEAQSTRR
jgi:hypothetical protein